MPQTTNFRLAALIAADAKNGQPIKGFGPAGGNVLRILDKDTGKLVQQIAFPAMANGVPMTCMADGRQQIAVIAIGSAGVPAELVALALP